MSSLPFHSFQSIFGNYSMTFVNQTMAIQASDYLGYQLVNTTTECLLYCDATVDCTFANTYHDNGGKNGSLQLTCSLYQTCHGTANLTNGGGQTQADGSIDFISESDGWCQVPPSATIEQENSGSGGSGQIPPSATIERENSGSGGSSQIPPSASIIGQGNSGGGTSSQIPSSTSIGQGNSGSVTSNQIPSSTSTGQRSSGGGPSSHSNSAKYIVPLAIVSGIVFFLALAYIFRRYRRRTRVRNHKPLTTPFITITQSDTSNKSFRTGNSRAMMSKYGSGLLGSSSKLVVDRVSPEPAENADTIETRRELRGGAVTIAPLRRSSVVVTPAQGDDMMHVTRVDFQALQARIAELERQRGEAGVSPPPEYGNEFSRARQGRASAQLQDR